MPDFPRVVMKVDHIDLTVLTANPALVAGRIWARDVVPYVRFSPDGTAVRSMDVDDHSAKSTGIHGVGTRYVAQDSVGGLDLAAHASRHASGGADAIPALGIARAQLEYPTVDVSFAYLACINKLKPIGVGNSLHGSVCTVDSFADKAVESMVSGSCYHPNYGRITNDANTYFQRRYTTLATADHNVIKVVAGTVSTLGSEAVDLNDDRSDLMKLSCLGSTIRGYRSDMTTAKVSVTDTAFTSGYFGIGVKDGRGDLGWGWAVLRAAASPSPEPLAYFEVPIVGSGTLEDPLRAQMPEEIITDPVLGERNLLALTHSSLIKTDKATGKPVDYRAIVRIFEQPDRDPAVRGVAACLDALRSTSGVRRLTRDDAIREAKRLDDLLTDIDLLPSKGKGKEYKAWRLKQFGVEMSDEEAERYAAESKGWT